jgi:cytochrome b
MQNTLSPHSQPAHASAQAAAPTRRVVDAPTRVFHALFALSFLGAYLTAEGERLRLLHGTLGYTMAGLLVARVLYGLVGPRHARLSGLLRKITGLAPWLNSVWGTWRQSATTPVNWRQGQNLLMALAIVSLLALVAPLTLSGYGTYNEWGDLLGGDWLGEVHELFGNAFLAVVVCHVGLVVLLSVLRRKNLAVQMLTGRVEGPGPDLVKRNLVWLAALVLVAVIGFWTWQWHDSPEGLITGPALRSLWSEAHDDD